MAKHTPGPWVTSATDDTVVIDATGREVAAIDGDYNDPDTWPQMEANGRLIAAAPDMLEALVRCRTVLSDEMTTTKEWKAALTAANFAIGKAMIVVDKS